MLFRSKEVESITSVIDQAAATKGQFIESILLHVAEKDALLHAMQTGVLQKPGELAATVVIGDVVDGPDEHTSPFMICIASA